MKIRVGYLKNSEYWLLVCFSALSLGLLVAVITISVGNQSMREQIQSRQIYIKQTVGLSKLNSELIQGLATASSKVNDQDIRRLLSDHGITFSTN